MLNNWCRRASFFIISDSFWKFHRALKRSRGSTGVYRQTVVVAVCLQLQRCVVELRPGHENCRQVRPHVIFISDWRWRGKFELARDRVFARGQLLSSGGSFATGARSLFCHTRVCVWNVRLVSVSRYKYAGFSDMCFPLAETACTYKTGEICFTCFCFSLRNLVKKADGKDKLV